MAYTAATGMPTIGDAIRAWRKFRELSSTELAEKAGVRIGYLSEIEHNRTASPREEHLKKLTDALHVPLGVIHGRRMPPEKSLAGIPSSSKQPTAGQRTRKASSRNSVYSSPLSISPQEVLMHRLAVVEKKLEEAVKNLHEAHEELREIGTLAADMQSTE